MQRTRKIGAKRGVMLEVDGEAVHALIAAGEHDRHRLPVVLLHGCGSLAEEIERPFLSADLPTIALDRPGYGFSTPLAADEHGPAGQSNWLERVLIALDAERVILVAHSLAAGAALLLGQRRPDLVSGLLLLAPFCRPTPHRVMPMLRLATTPFIGPLFCRHVIGPFADFIGQRCLRESFRPNLVPDDFHLPFHHGANPSAIRTMADELLAFNDDMQHFRELSAETRLFVLHGREDASADPDWHLPWLSARSCHARLHLLPDTGHMPHHVDHCLARTLLKELFQDVASGKEPDVMTEGRKPGVREESFADGVA